MTHQTKVVSTGYDATLVCPSCGEAIRIEHALEEQAHSRIRLEYQHKFSLLQKQVEDQVAALERERLEVKHLSAQTWEIIQEELKQERIRLAEQLKQEAQDDAQAELQRLRKDLMAEQAAYTKLKKQELELLAREQILLQKQARSKVELERELLHRAKLNERRLQDQFAAQMELLQVEYEKQLTDQKRLLQEMQRKVNQGSVQMQGEVQEIAIERFLKQKFPGDDIVRIKAGKRGGDCIQAVKDRNRVAGTLYIESKRTKSFQKTWIEKLKEDLRRHKADVGLLVTQVMPKDMGHIGLIDGVWICSFESFKGLIPVIRHHLVRLHDLRVSQQQRDDKMHLLYDFLTSNEFRMQVEGIVEGFTALHPGVTKRKNRYAEYLEAARETVGEGVA